MATFILGMATFILGMATFFLGLATFFLELATFFLETRKLENGHILVPQHWIIGFRYTQHSSVRDEYKFVYYILESDPFSFKNLYPREMNLSDFNFTRCIL